VFVLTLPLFASIGSAGGAGVGVFADPSEPGVFAIGGGPLDPGPALAQGVDIGTILFAVVALAISHGLSFWWNYLVRGEYRRTTAIGQMFAPYGRLVVLHVTIILGGMAIAFTGAPAAAVAILVALKTAMDLGFHLAEHRATPAPTLANAAPIPGGSPTSSSTSPTSPTTD
jgi:hypothetical protein